ncbi:MAG TPA: hypothetical protein VI934_04105 [Candidatus Nanoarchaeia archaeon]|nr:hypothetical protein [Candidatus Nanoarchaeia archaeon]
MLKAVKIPEEAYNEAKKLGKELETEKAIRGVYKVTLSTAISFAISRTLAEIEKRKRFTAAAGGWKDIDTEKMIKDIYEGRKFGTKWDITFD